MVFDLDGTLALCGHRQHFLERAPRDWDSWHAACVNDELCLPVFRTLTAHLQAGHRVEIWTGRSNHVRIETEDWFDRHGIEVGLLTLMRPVGDHRPDIDLKREWLSAARKNGGPPDLVYEDRARVVAMWREEGVACFQVAPGAY